MHLILVKRRRYSERQAGRVVGKTKRTWQSLQWDMQNVSLASTSSANAVHMDDPALSKRPSP